MPAICEKVRMNFNGEKLDDLVVHISRSSRDDLNFDETKLRLLLAFSDFLAYGRRGEPITGTVYVKLPFGPAPQNSDGETVSFVDALNDAPGDALSPEEIAIADEIVERYRDWTSSALVDEAKREFTGWRLADEGEHIPYGSVFLAADQTPSPAAIELGQRFAQELGLTAP
jgi:hypothetical protein